MMKSLFVTLLLGVALSGCASRHYVEQHADTLWFFLHLPEAGQVRFCSSADNYVLHDTVQNREGNWQIKIPAAGELKYFYVVDGSVYLPECRFRETDDFGSENCLYLP